MISACEFLGFGSGAVENSIQLGCGAVSLVDWYPTFRQIVLSSAAEWSMKNAFSFIGRLFE
jgi:uncharacterized protein YktA (UPF0223 family)